MIQWTVAHQAPLSMEILQARILEWVAMPSSRGIFSSQGLNPGLLPYRQILYHLSHQGSPRILEWVADPFSRGFSWSRNATRVSCSEGGFFTSWVTREAQCSSLLLSQCISLLDLLLVNIYVSKDWQFHLKQLFFAFLELNSTHTPVKCWLPDKNLNSTLKENVHLI